MKKKILAFTLTVLLCASSVFGWYTLQNTDTVNAAIMTKIAGNLTELLNYVTGVTSPTLLTPTIASFTNATHNHSNAAGGGSTFGGAWTDYSASTVVTGFSSVTTKNVYYKAHGGIMFVEFCVGGTSNSTYTYFTLPTARASGPGNHGTVRGEDNGSGLTAPGYCFMSSNVLNCKKDWSGNDWTASGSKLACGQLWYPY